MSDIKTMEIKEFVEKGFLQEVNRMFFHPLGLALAVKQNEDESWSLHEIWDYRDDPEGMFFGENVIDKDKVNFVEELRKSKLFTRYNEVKDIDVDENGIQKITNKE